MNISKSKKIELLAPAGDYECFIKAIEAGADAVYLGLDKFGARANAHNFSLEELVMAIEQAHILGKRVFLTINTLFKDSEIEELYDFLLIPYKKGLDGVIVQDIGVVLYIKKHFPNLEVHASTQMAITDVSGVEFARKLGICRVVPARELSLEEIKNIYTKTGMELECFIHGAMCYSYSGKCLMSSFIGGRSGNRGRCAQPCRLPYEGDNYLLSMKDMCTLSILDKLIESGIFSFKIEGRMKSPAYVYGVTSIYRKYIDLYLSGKEYTVEKNDLDEILSTYTRSGNCNGYYFQKNGRKMLTISSGAYNTEGSSHSSCESDDNIKLPISMSCNIHKDTNISLKVVVSDVNSIYFERSYEYISDVIPQEAKNSGATLDSVRKQITKTGNSFYKIDECNVNLDDGLFISNGQLNQIRRMCLEGLNQELLSGYYRDVDELFLGSESSEGTKSESEIKADTEINKSEEVSRKSMDVNVFPLGLEQLKNVINSEIMTSLILNYDLFNKLFINKSISISNAFINRIKNGLKIYIKLPYIIRDEEKCFSENKLKQFIYDGIVRLKEDYNIELSGVYVSNYESFNIIKMNFPDLEIIGDIHLYSYNRSAYDLLHNLGMNKLVMPVELNKKEILKRNCKNEEIIVYGRTPTMISSQCINLTMKKCEKTDLGFLRYITDRKGERLPVYCSCEECSNVIYNTVPTYILNEVEFLKKLKARSIRIDFIDEDKKQIDEVLNKVNLFINGYGDLTLSGKHTKGHINRGVE